jgi:hypothetical protein
MKSRKCELLKRGHDVQHNDTQHSNTQHEDTQHNDIQHNDTQHNDIQHSDTQQNSFIVTLSRSYLTLGILINVSMLSVVILNVVSPLKRSRNCQ